MLILGGGRRVSQISLCFILFKKKLIITTTTKNKKVNTLLSYMQSGYHDGRDMFVRDGKKRSGTTNLDVFD